MIIPKNGFEEIKPEKEYYRYGEFVVDGARIINKANAFSEKGVLVVPGIIVEPHTMQVGSDIAWRKMDFFKVAESSLPEIPTGCLVVIVPYSGYNFSGSKYFVEPQNILVSIKDLVLPGPDFVFLEKIIEPGLFKMIIPNKGKKDGAFVYTFTRHESEIVLNDVPIWIVRRSHLVGYE
jgi:hypothetical protein